MNVVKADGAQIARAGRILRAGGLVAFPTETVYGLGANAFDSRAVQRIYEAKGRPAFNPLIVHVAGMADAEAIAEFDQRARLFAKTFWPGPLTLVLASRTPSPVASEVAAGLPTLALRMPASSLAQRLIAAADCPLAAPSANRSGSVSPTRAEHVAVSLGGAVDLILDGGPCGVGLESTILDLSGDRPTILRPGGLSREALEELGGRMDIAGQAVDRPKAPGQLLAHYAPERPVRLNAEEGRPGEAFIGFGPSPAGVVANLSPAGDLAEAAAHLYAIMHEFDRPPFTGLAFMPVPEHGLGRAINDRLLRAAYRDPADGES